MLNVARQGDDFIVYSAELQAKEGTSLITASLRVFARWVALDYGVPRSPYFFDKAICEFLGKNA